MKAVRWEMIGCGDVTRRKSAPAYSKVPGSRLVAVASRRPTSAKAFASANGIEHVFEDPEELIGSPEVDALYIATPPSSHRALALALALALRVAEAGKPCCVENPLAMCHSEAAEMVHAFEAAGQPLFVAYYRRSLPRFG